MSFETLIGPVLSALWNALKLAKEHDLKKNAKDALSEAIGELVKLSPNVELAEAKIAIAKAAGIIHKDLFKAEKMLSSVKHPTEKFPLTGVAIFSKQKAAKAKTVKTVTAVKTKVVKTTKSRAVKVGYSTKKIMK